MSQHGREHPGWKAVAVGWMVAVSAGAVIGPVVGSLYGLVVGAPLQRERFTASAVVVSLACGFLAYLLGGFVSARLAGAPGGLAGAATAVLGLVVGTILALALGRSGMLFTGSVALPPSGFGVSRATLPAGLLLFLVDLFGAYTGGKLGEPYSGVPRSK